MVSGEMHAPDLDITERMYSDAIEIVNDPAEVYTFSHWEKNEKDNPGDPGQLFIRLHEFDLDFVELTSSLVFSSALVYTDWTQCSTTISGAGGAGATTLNANTIFVRFSVYASLADDGKNWYTDDWRLGSTTLTLTRGMLMPVDDSRTRYQVIEAGLGGTIYVRDQRTESTEFNLIINALSEGEYEDFIIFLDHADVQWGRNKLMFTDNDSVDHDIKIIPRSIEFNEIAANLYDVSFLFQDEGRQFP